MRAALTIYLLFLSGISFGSEYYKVYPLITGSGTCTASVMKMNNQCVMMTNHHCNKDLSQNLVLAEPKPGGLLEEHTLEFDEILAADPAFDALFYSVPEAMKGVCEGLIEAPAPNIREQMRSEIDECQKSTVGVTTDGNSLTLRKEMIQYVNEPNTIHLVTLSRMNWERPDYEEWQVFPARTYMGMSGGLVSACENEVPLGLINGTYIGRNRTTFTPLITLRKILEDGDILTREVNPRFVDYTDIAREAPENTRADAENPRRYPENTRKDAENPRRFPENTRKDSENPKKYPTKTYGAADLEWELPLFSPPAKDSTFGFVLGSGLRLPGPDEIGPDETRNAVIAEVLRQTRGEIGETEFPTITITGSNDLPTRDELIPLNLEQFRKLGSTFDGPCAEYLDLLGGDALGMLLEVNQGIVDRFATDEDRREIIAIRCDDEGEFISVDGVSTIEKAMVESSFSSSSPAACARRDISELGPDDFIYRDDEGYPPLEIRQSLFDRISGSFEQLTFHTSENTETVQFDIAKALENGQPFASDEYIFKDTFKMEVGDQELTLFQNGLKIDMKFTPSPDFKTFTLTSPIVGNGKPLTCDNKNYTKLICRNNESTFSVSTSGREMNWRWARKNHEGTSILFSHGAGGRSPEPLEEPPSP